MRELPLLEADGTVRESAAIVALAYMKYPDDPQSADAMAAALASDAFGRSLSAFSQETWARALEAETSGTVAGALLLRMLSFAIHRPEDRFSLNKAVFLHSREVGTPHRSTILKFWGQHKSVAHFWSAISARHAGGDTPLAGAPAPDARLHVDVEHRRITPLGPRERNPSEAQAIESILTVGQTDSSRSRATWPLPRPGRLEAMVAAQRLPSTSGDSRDPGAESDVGGRAPGIQSAQMGEVKLGRSRLRRD